jgi:hypothetical protein
MLPARLRAHLKRDHAPFTHPSHAGTTTRVQRGGMGRDRRRATMPGMKAPTGWLTQSLWVLDVGKGAFVPVVVRDRLGLAAMMFTQRALAEAERQRFPRPPQLLELPAGDYRAREEWLQAVHAAGAARTLFDPPPPSQRVNPPAGPLTAALLAEVISHKRGLACL